jgi:hypothetical protein
MIVSTTSISARATTGVAHALNETPKFKPGQVTAAVTRFSACCNPRAACAAPGINAITSIVYGKPPALALTGAPQTVGACANCSKAASRSHRSPACGCSPPLHVGSAPSAACHRRAARQYATVPGSANVRSPKRSQGCGPVAVSSPAPHALRACKKSSDAVLNVVPAFPSEATDRVGTRACVTGALVARCHGRIVPLV